MYIVLVALHPDIEAIQSQRVIETLKIALHKVVLKITDCLMFSSSSLRFRPGTPPTPPLLFRVRRTWATSGQGTLVTLAPLPFRTAKDGDYFCLWSSVRLVAMVAFPLLSSSHPAFLLWLLCLLATSQNETSACYCHYRRRENQGSHCEASVVFFSLSDYFNSCEFSEPKCQTQQEF